MITVNINKAKDYVHCIRRDRRAKEFEPYDNIIMKQIPGNDSVNAEAERQKIRDKYSVIQEQINSVKNLDELDNIRKTLI